MAKGFRWVQLLVGIVCMVMIANLQYGWTLFANIATALLAIAVLKPWRFRLIRQSEQQVPRGMEASAAVRA